MDLLGFLLASSAMGEIKRVSLPRGKRTIEVAPAGYGANVASIRIINGVMGAIALITEQERQSLIRALGGEVPSK